MKKYTLEIVVFISGAVVMVLELVGSRVLAPYVGTSLPVWTSLIGIILASLSVGYFLGGRLADKNPNYKTLSIIFFGAAIFVTLIALFKEGILGLLQLQPLTIPARSILGTLLLFVIPTVLLGMISPYATRLRIQDVSTSGKAIGNLYAISTIGSIVGTFLAGFFLIAYIGTTKILFLLAALLFVASFLIHRESFAAIKIALFIAVVASYFGSYALDMRARAQGFVDIDTHYNRVWVQEEIDWFTGEPIRVMLIGGEHDSAIFLDSDELVFEYTRFYRMGGHFNPDIKQALMIGGGGYSYPKDFLAKFPEATMDVVEIDFKVTELAQKFFRLEDDPRLNIYHEDGRTFLNTAAQKYDAIYGDAFSSFFSLPYQLTTREAVEKMYNLLEDDGVVLVNIISAIRGDKGKFLRAEYRTFKEFFPHVYLFPGSKHRDPLSNQNVMLLALKSSEEPSFVSSNPEIQGYLDNRWEGEIPFDMPVLTDDFAPVDQYIAEILK